MKEAAGSCDHTQAFWDGIPVSSLCIVHLAPALALPGRFVRA